jgi:hypothetical protein
MSQNLDIKSLWKTKETEVPDVSKVYSRVKEFKKHKVKSLIITNVMLFSTAIFIGLIWFYFKPVYISTKIGIVSIIFAIVIYLVVLNRIIPMMNEIELSESNRDYLLKLLRIKKTQKFFNKIIVKIYFVLLSLGLALYLYEYVVRMSPIWAVVCYCVTAFWIVLNWLYFVPRSIKKQDEKLNNLISGFQNLKDQL